MLRLTSVFFNFLVFSVYDIINFCSDLTLPVGENSSRSELDFANRALLK